MRRFSLTSSFLPHLEVQGLYAVGKHEGKEGCKSHQNSCNWPNEVRIITKVAFDVRFYSNFLRWSRHGYSSLVVSILRYDQPVHGPRNRADPIIPHPPLGNSLKIQKVSLDLYGWFKLDSHNIQAWEGNERLTGLGTKKPEKRLKSA